MDKQKDHVLLGVLSHHAEHYKINISSLRVAFAVVSLFYFDVMVVLYLGLLIMMRYKLYLPIQGDDFSTLSKQREFVLGLIIVLFGIGMITKYLVPWLNVGFILAVLLLIWGFHTLKHRKLRT